MKIVKSISLIIVLGFVSMSFVKVKNELKPISKKVVETKVEEPSFVEFLSHFKKVDLPFEYGIDEMDIKGVVSEKAKNKMMHKPQNIALNVPMQVAMKFIPEIKRASFGRMGPPEVEAIARFYPNENTVAVVYGLQSRFGNNFNKNIYLLCYDLKGNVLGVKRGEEDFHESPIVAFSSVEKTGTFRIDEQGNFWKNTYVNRWEEKVKMSGIIGNRIKEFSLVDSEVFKIDEKGALVNLSGQSISLK